MNSPLTAHSPAAIYQHLESGEIGEAERMARRSLADAPDNESLLLLLAMALHQQQRYDEAIPLYRRLTELSPGLIEHWSNLGTVEREAGHLDNSERAYARALSIDPTSVDANFNAGLLQMERGSYVEAKRHFLLVTGIDTTHYEARIYGAMMCYECGENPGAERLLSGWSTWNRLADSLTGDLAWLLIQLGDTTSGERLLRQTLGSTSERVRSLARLTLLKERVNKLDEACRLAESLPEPGEIADGDVRNEVINAKASLAARGADLNAARELLEHLISLIDQEYKRSNIYFSLGHVCDKLGDYDAAMDAFKKAHASQLLTAGQVMPELLAPDAEPLRISTFLVDREQFARWKTLRAPAADQSPVFVVGFPRSGTTMLEQMLDAHSSMQSMDERAFLQGVIERMNRVGLTYPEQLDHVDEVLIEDLRATYWAQVTRVIKLTPGQRLVDKNPLNMLRLPMIYRLFPRAKVILCLRHPCDVLMSNYMQSFRSPAFAVLCSSLERLARGYVNAMRSWIHHADLLKPDLLIWRYEAALDDFGGHVRRLGEFLELEDTSPLEQFHEHARNKGFISTPSYHQVVQPPNKKALGRWRRYEAHFTEAVRTLQPMLEHWGYDV